MRLIGPIGDKSTETAVILLENNVSDRQFSVNVLNCLPSTSWVPSETDLKVRADFRNFLICSIDPPGCTDIDDALHCRMLPNGNYETGVRILSSPYAFYTDLHDITFPLTFV